MLCGNVFPHSTAATPEAVGYLKFELFPHPSYRPDLAASDYHYVWTTKRSLEWMKFGSDYEVKGCSTNVASTTANFPLRWDQKACELLHNMHLRNGWVKHCAFVTDCCRLHLKCDGTHAETRFCLSGKWTSPFKSAGVSVQSNTGS